MLRPETENAGNLKRNMQLTNSFQKLTVREKKRGKKRRQECDIFKMHLNSCQMEKCIDQRSEVRKYRCVHISIKM